VKHEHSGGRITRLLDIRQAAQFLLIAESTLYGWVWQKRIPFIKVGRRVRFDLLDLERFLESNRYRPR
jgi:excisionase family DNA binding protein